MSGGEVFPHDGVCQIPSHARYDIRLTALPPEREHPAFDRCSVTSPICRYSLGMSDGDPSPAPLPGESESSLRTRRWGLWAILVAGTVGA